MAIAKGFGGICIHTREIEKATDFYTKVLGFEHYHTYVFKEEPIIGMRFNYLRAGSCSIVLAQPKDLSWVNELGNTNGNHFKIEVLGLDEMVETLADAGYPIEEGQPGGCLDCFPNGERSVFFSGPSGERICLVEYGFYG